jgi:hypothetical protein
MIMCYVLCYRRVVAAFKKNGNGKNEKSKKAVTVKRETVKR